MQHNCNGLRNHADSFTFMPYLGEKSKDRLRVLSWMILYILHNVEQGTIQTLTIVW